MSINTSNQSFNLTATVLNGLNTGNTQLNKISHDINQSSNLPPNDISHAIQESPKKPTDFSYPETHSKRSIEENIIGTTKTKTQMQAMLKILEIENQLFDKSLGKIVNQNA